MSALLIEKIDKWLQRLAADPNGFQISERGSGGVVLRVKSPGQGIPDEDVNAFAVSGDMDTTDIATAILEAAQNDADGQGGGLIRYVIHAYRNQEQKAFARFSLPIQTDTLDESAIDLPQRQGPVFQPNAVTESAMEMHMRHSENTHRMMIGSTHALMEGFIQQGRQSQKTAELHTKMLEDNLVAAHELAQRREERDARIAREASKQEMLQHVLGKGVEVLGPLVQIGLAHLVQRLQASNEPEPPAPQIVSAEPVAPEPPGPDMPPVSTAAAEDEPPASV